MTIRQQARERDRIGTPFEKKLEDIMSPFQRFTHDQTTGSILLIICTLAALLIANSTLARGYESLLLTETGLVFGDWSLTMSLRHWINEGLMSLFFFVLGLEIKRELLVGELRGVRRSLPMIAAALGGMLVPALLYTAFTAGTPLVHGWGIPMATDTAFAVGVLALLRKHIPAGLTAFLTALAILDDLGAILVIAVFYTRTLNLSFLAAAAVLLVILIILNMLGMRRPSVYFLVGGLVWLAMLGSGVHATVAGVLVALTVPARPKRGPDWFVNQTHELADEFASLERESARPLLGEEAQHAVAEQVQDTVEKATTPLQRWEGYLETPPGQCRHPGQSAGAFRVVVRTPRAGNCRGTGARQGDRYHLHDLAQPAAGAWTTAAWRANAPYCGYRTAWRHGLHDVDLHHQPRVHCGARHTGHGQDGHSACLPGGRHCRFPLPAPAGACPRQAGAGRCTQYRVNFRKQPADTATPNEMPRKPSRMALRPCCARKAKGPRQGVSLQAIWYARRIAADCTVSL